MSGLIETRRPPRRGRTAREAIEHGPVDSPHQGRGLPACSPTYKRKIIALASTVS
jgi:hypothetical protein